MVLVVTTCCCKTAAAAVVQAGCVRRAAVTELAMLRPDMRSDS